jgi:hypothetical protein
VAHGIGTQAPWTWSCLKASRVAALSCGLIDTSPPPEVSLLSPLFLSQVRRATSWVLPSCGEADGLPLRSAGPLMSGLTTSDAPPGGAGDDPQRLAPRLGVAVDGGVGPEVGGVDGVGEQGLDGGRSGVVGRGLQLDVGPELVGEVPFTPISAGAWVMFGK